MNKDNLFKASINAQNAHLRDQQQKFQLMLQAAVSDARTQFVGVILQRLLGDELSAFAQKLSGQEQMAFMKHLRAREGFMVVPLRNPKMIVHDEARLQVGVNRTVVGTLLVFMEGNMIKQQMTAISDELVPFFPLASPTITDWLLNLAGRIEGADALYQKAVASGIKSVEFVDHPLIPPAASELGVVDGKADEGGRREGEGLLPLPQPNVEPCDGNTEEEAAPNN